MDEIMLPGNMISSIHRAGKPLFANLTKIAKCYMIYSK